MNEITAVLYKKIITPLLPSLDNKSQILISPDGQLNLIPFEILPDINGRYMIEKYRVSYFSSGRDLLKNENIQKRSGYFLALANPEFNSKIKAKKKIKSSETPHLSDIRLGYSPSRGGSDCLIRKFEPLPYTEAEVHSITKILKKKGNYQVSIFYGEKAEESVIKRTIPTPDIMHLSTHGYFCEDKKDIMENPLLRSGLAFAGVNMLSDETLEDNLVSDDGFLTALEVSGLNLSRTDLVVLSACETGVGDVRNGEGVFGLRRAFQYAGAETVLMSLWKVPDKETYELMKEFYSNWLMGESKIDALRKATLKIIYNTRKKYGAAHPYYWGGFILLGNPN